MGVEIKSLDGERKALVYDNYSKLISATDTIRKVGSSFAHFLFQCGRGILILATGGRVDANEHGPSHPHYLDARTRHHTHCRNGNRVVGFAARPYREPSRWSNRSGRQEWQIEATRNCPVGPTDA